MGGGGIWNGILFRGYLKLNLSNYQPVALTERIAKVIERMVREQIIEYLELRTRMDNSKYGSIAGCSTLSQLLIQYQHILDILEAKVNT